VQVSDKHLLVLLEVLSRSPHPCFNSSLTDMLSTSMQSLDSQNHRSAGA